MRHWQTGNVPYNRHRQGDQGRNLQFIEFFGGEKMASSPAFALQKPLEDPLEHLPCSNVVAYRKGQLIYSQDQPAKGFFLVITGKVKISRVVVDGEQVVVDIYRQDEFFGEAAILGLAQQTEQAAALEDTKVMMWEAPMIEDLIMKRPRLGLALLQLLVQRSIDLTRRIESHAVECIPRRIARALIRFADRLGTAEENGAVRMMPLTQELLAQYVGTSREIVTLHMSQFRREGYLRYSRQDITIYRDAFCAALLQDRRSSASRLAA